MTSATSQISFPLPAMFCRDNLEVLRGLNSASVDLIYLDPPFNKGKEFHAPVGSKASVASFSDIWAGGTDHPDNLQLLCHHCNSIKGNRPMEYLQTRIRLREGGRH